MKLVCEKGRNKQKELALSSTILLSKSNSICLKKNVFISIERKDKYKKVKRKNHECQNRNYAERAVIH